MTCKNFKVRPETQAKTRAFRSCSSDFQRFVVVLMTLLSEKRESVREIGTATGDSVFL